MFIGSHLNSGKLSIFLIFFDVFGINGAIKFEMFAIIYVHVYVILLNSSISSFAFFQGSFGADVFDALRRYELAAVNYTSDALERWTGPGTSNSMPRIVLGDTPKNFRPSTLLVHDASFLRLRNLQVIRCRPS